MSNTTAEARTDDWHLTLQEIKILERQRAKLHRLMCCALDRKSPVALRIAKRHAKLCDVIATAKRVRAEQGEELEGIKAILLRMWPEIEKCKKEQAQ